MINIMQQSVRVGLDQRFKDDHSKRPIIIIKITQTTEERDSNKYEIILERFHHKAKEAEEFLIQVAEPSSLTNNIQTFQINFYSLYTAMALKLTEDDIIKKLNEFSKNETVQNKQIQVPAEIVKFIKDHTQYFNRASLFLKDDKYYIDIETQLFEQILQRRHDEVTRFTNMLIHEEDIRYPENIEEDPEKGAEPIQFQTRRRFKIKDNDYFSVSKYLVERINVPVSSEYRLSESDKDTRLNDRYKPKQIVKLYDHQNKAISKIFKENIARSGVIILPCGAGKTLLGISVALRVKKRTLIICDSVNSILQWKAQFLHYSFLEEQQIVQITSTNQGQSKEQTIKLLRKQNIIVIVTQDMILSERDDVKELRAQSWNCCIIDEVHGLPAAKVSEAFSKLKVNMKIGLTATPFRQDNKIREIFYQVGPKLHESMIVDLTTLGFVSKIYCIQVQVGMNEKYKSFYERQKNTSGTSANQQILNTLYQMNPRKYEVAQYLIDLHRSRKDKILIFCEKINKLSKTGTLIEFAKENKCPIILQDVDQRERQAIYKLFREDELDVIIFGQIADQGLDLPSANVGIQISFNFNSVRQEFQRMGRIQRKKENIYGIYDCFFYTIVTKGTNEVKIQFDRQMAVINQGYPYEVIDEKQILGEVDITKKDKDKKLKQIISSMEEKIMELQRTNRITGGDDD